MVETNPITSRLKHSKCENAINYDVYDLRVASGVNGRSDTTSAHPQHTNLNIGVRICKVPVRHSSKYVRM